MKIYCDDGATQRLVFGVLPFINRTQHSGQDSIQNGRDDGDLTQTQRTGQG